MFSYSKNRDSLKKVSTKLRQNENLPDYYEIKSPKTGLKSRELQRASSVELAQYAFDRGKKRNELTNGPQHVIP